MRARQDGFSLLEVLVAITLIGFIALAVAPMFVLASRSNKSGGQMGRCSALAMERMEQLRGDELNTLAAGGSLTQDVSGYVDTSPEDYVVRWRIVDLGAPAGAKQIEVRTVALRPSIGPLKQVTFMTLRVP